MDDKIEQMWKVLPDGARVQTGRRKIYFIIDDYDVRYFRGGKVLVEINTYPNNPRDVLKLIDHLIV